MENITVFFPAIIYLLIALDAIILESSQYF